MSANFVASAKNGGFVAGGTGVTVTHGFTLADGDVLYAFCTKGDDTGTGARFASSSGGTWTAILTAALATTVGNDMATNVLRRVVTNASGEPSTYTFTVVGTTESRAMNVIVVQVRGADTSTPEDTTPTTNTGTNDFTPTHVNITTTTSNCLVLVAHAGSLADGTAAAKTGGAPSYADALIDYQSAADSSTSGFDSFIEVAYKANAPAGTQTIDAWTGSADDSSSEWHVVSVAVRSSPITGTVDGSGSASTATAAAKEAMKGAAVGSGSAALASLEGAVGSSPTTGTIAGTQVPPGAEIAALEMMKGTAAGAGTASTADVAAVETFVGELAGTSTASVASLEGTETATGQAAGAGAVATAALEGTVAAVPVTGTSAGIQPGPAAELNALLTVIGDMAGAQVAHGAALEGQSVLAATGNVAGAQPGPSADLGGVIVTPISGELAGVQATQTAILSGIGGTAAAPKRGGYVYRQQIIPRPKLRIGGRAFGMQAHPTGIMRGLVNDDDLVLLMLEAA